MKTSAVSTLFAFAFLYAPTSLADSFGSGANQFDIEFVDIGNAENPDDTTGSPNPVGKVEYAYRMGKFEISEDMIDKANTLGGLGITKDTRGPDKPATSISWFEAAQFVNWLNTDSGSTEAYKFDSGGNFQLWASGDTGYNPDNLYRNSGAKYFLPSFDEWYKAAYYNAGTASYGDYPTANGLVPTAVASGTAANTAVFQNTLATSPADITQAGGLSPYGTMGQGGNVWEWEETEFDLVNDSSSSARGIRGGNWFLNSNNLSSSFRSGLSFPTSESFNVGFRVASISSIPEPSTLLLGVLATGGLLLQRRRFAMDRLMKTSATLILLAFSTIYASTAQADSFGFGGQQFDIEFVDIGNADNPDDITGNPNPAGKVEYSYRMGKYEISRDMITKANNEGGLGITMDSMGFVIGGPRDDMPATGVSWFEAATFVNWLNTSQGHQAAYNFDSGGIFQLWTSAEAWQAGGENLFRHKDAYYFLPSADEWYKAAYYDASSSTYFDYPTGSDTAPTAVTSGTAADTAVYDTTFSQGPADITLAGGLSPYGTMGQGANVWEWEEAEFDLVNDSSSSDRGVRGGNWFGNFNGLLSSIRGGSGPTIVDDDIGFRVASIPEPSTLLLGALAAGGLLLQRRR